MFVFLFTFADGSSLCPAASYGAYPICKGCSVCSRDNGCVNCQPKLFLFLRRERMRQYGECLHDCPAGYYGMRSPELNMCSSKSSWAQPYSFSFIQPPPVTPQSPPHCWLFPTPHFPQTHINTPVTPPFSTAHNLSSTKQRHTYLTILIPHGSSVHTGGCRGAKPRLSPFLSPGGSTVNFSEARALFLISLHYQTSQGFFKALNTSANAIKIHLRLRPKHPHRDSYCPIRRNMEKAAPLATPVNIVWTIRMIVQ